MSQRYFCPAEYTLSPKLTLNLVFLGLVLGFVLVLYSAGQKYRWLIFSVASSEDTSFLCLALRQFPRILWEPNIRRFAAILVYVNQIYIVSCICHLYLQELIENYIFVRCVLREKQWRFLSRNQRCNEQAWPRCHDSLQVTTDLCLYLSLHSWRWRIYNRRKKKKERKITGLVTQSVNIFGTKQEIWVSLWIRSCKTKWW